MAQELQTDPNFRLRSWAAGLAFLAGFLNLISVGEYSDAWFTFSAAFLLIAASEAFYGVLLLFAPWQYDGTGGRRFDLEHDGWPYYVAGVLLALTPIALYIAIYTTRLGQMQLLPGGTLAPTVASLATRCVEVVLVGCLVVLVQRARRVTKVANQPLQAAEPNNG